MCNDKKLLMECMIFNADPNLLKESTVHSDKPFKVQGILQRKGKRNQNGRIYPDDILIREADKYAKTYIADRRAIGELDHPNSNEINLKNVSHNIIEMHWVGDDLVGTVEILTTPSGNILKELFKNGIKLGISSRGVGTLKKVDEQTSMVGEDYELLCFDFVSNPSTQGAFLAPMDQQALSEGVVKNVLTNKWERCDSIIRDILTESN